MRSLHNALLSLFLICAILSVPSLGAETNEPVLGPDGTMLQLHAGAYGDLFPGGSQVDPAHAVLALDVIGVDGASARHLVPGTESPHAKASATLVYEESNRTAYLLWQTVVNGLHPLLHLTSFDGEGWSELIEITSNPFAAKGLPQIVVTRDVDRVVDPARQAATEVDRTVVHVTWWEAAPGGSVKRYAPIVLVAGEHLGSIPVIDLSGLLPEAADRTAPPVSPGIEQAIQLQPGPNSRSVIVGFLDPASSKLSALEIEVLPRALSRLAEQTVERLADLAASGLSREEVGAQIYEQILEIGTEFHAASLTYIAEKVRDLVLTSDDLTLGDLGSKARGQIIGIGVRFKANGLEVDGEPLVVEIASTPTGEGPFHFLKATIVAERQAPEVPAPAALYLSQSGEDALLAWDGEQHVYYLESQGADWAGPFSLELGPNLDRQTAHQILQQRTYHR